MNQISITLHKRAMDFADEALLAKKQGSKAIAISFFEKAYILEREAAFSFKSKDDNTNLYKSILLRSAATLALDAGYIWDAEYIANYTLENNPHSMIIAELEEVIEKSKNFKIKGKNNKLRIVGTIVAVDSINNAMKLQPTNGNASLNIQVPKSHLHKIVKDYWASEVVIQGQKDIQGVLLLEKIQKAA